MGEGTSLIGEVNWAVSSILAIVLSMLANILTGPAQNIFAGFNASVARKRSVNLRKRLEEIEQYLENPSELYLCIIFLLLKIIFVTLLAFVIGDLIAASVTAMIDDSIRTGVDLSPIVDAYVSSNFLYSLGQFSTALLYLMALNFTLIGLRLVWQVRNYERMKFKLDNIISKLDKRGG